MDEHFKVASSWLLLIVAVLALFCVPLCAGIYLGFAWTVLALIACAALVYYLGGKAGMNGGMEIILGGGFLAFFGAVVGLGIRWVPVALQWLKDMA